jgi:ribosome recycling factor
MKQKDTYKEVRTFQYDNAIVRVHIPDLTAEERSRRMREIERAAARLLASRK